MSIKITTKCMKIDPGNLKTPEELKVYENFCEIKEEVDDDRQDLINLDDDYKTGQDLASGKGIVRTMNSTCGDGTTLTYCRNLSYNPETQKVISYSKYSTFIGEIPLNGKGCISRFYGGVLVNRADNLNYTPLPNGEYYKKNIDDMQDESSTEETYTVNDNGTITYNMTDKRKIGFFGKMTYSNNFQPEQ